MRFILCCLILTVLTSLCQSNDGNGDHIHFYLSPVSQEQVKDISNESIGEFNCLLLEPNVGFDLKPDRQCISVVPVATAIIITLMKLYRFAQKCV